MEPQRLVSYYYRPTVLQEFPISHAIDCIPVPQQLLLFTPWFSSHRSSTISSNGNSACMHDPRKPNNATDGMLDVLHVQLDSCTPNNMRQYNRSPLTVERSVCKEVSPVSTGKIITVCHCNGTSNDGWLEQYWLSSGQFIAYTRLNC